MPVDRSPRRLALGIVGLVGLRRPRARRPSRADDRATGSGAAADLGGVAAGLRRLLHGRGHGERRGAPRHAAAAHLVALLARHPAVRAPRGRPLAESPSNRAWVGRWSGSSRPRRGGSRPDQSGPSARLRRAGATVLDHSASTPRHWPKRPPRTAGSSSCRSCRSRKATCHWATTRTPSWCSTSRRQHCAGATGVCVAPRRATGPSASISRTLSDSTPGAPRGGFLRRGGGYRRRPFDGGGHRRADVDPRPARGPQCGRPPGRMVPRGGAPRGNSRPESPSRTGARRPGRRSHHRRRGHGDAGGGVTCGAGHLEPRFHETSGRSTSRWTSRRSGPRAVTSP